MTEITTTITVESVEAEDPVAAMLSDRSYQEELAEASKPVERLRWRDRRKLGASRRGIIRTARELKADGRLSSLPDVAAAQIAHELVADNPDFARECSDKVGTDWTEFLEALAAFIERILPIILAFFGGL
jgi:hypothetical protein